MAVQTKDRAEMIAALKVYGFDIEWIGDDVPNSVLQTSLEYADRVRAAFQSWFLQRTWHADHLKAAVKDAIAQ